MDLEEAERDRWFGQGWAFYVGGGAKRGLPLPALDDPLVTLEWMKGFAAALADSDLSRYYPSIEAALVDFGLTGELLEELLQACELIQDSEEWCRWPVDRPIRERR